jgi:AraC-like DNA-binding protein
MSQSTPDTPREPEGRDLATGNGWRVSEVICYAGPQDRPFEELHSSVSIAAVVAGSFNYRCPEGRALLSPGSLLLGNAGSCFECGHEHSVGDRCVAFHYDPDYFAEIAASAAGSSRFRFKAAMLPALRALARPVATAETATRVAESTAMEELAIGLAERVLGIVSDSHPTALAPSSRDQQRISRALRQIEDHCDEALDLDTLASVACMSKYHFLRCFRRIVGVTPHQFLLSARLRRAAVALRTGQEPVSTIAFDCGFGDLSTFNAQFRQAFGAAPGTFRRENRRLVPVDANRAR